MPKPVPKAIQFRDEQEAARVVTYLRSVIMEAEQDRKAFLTNVTENRKLLLPRQARVTPPFPGACDLAINSCKYDTNAIRARLCRAMLAPSPLYNIEAHDEAAAQRIEQFLQDLITRRVKLPQIGSHLVEAALIDGVGIGYVRWHTERRERLIWQQQERILPTDSRWRRETRMQTIYDAPIVELVPLEDCWTYPPTAGDLQKSTGVYLFTRLSGDDLLMGARTATYDVDAVEHMRTVPPDEDGGKTLSDEAREIRRAGFTEADFHAAVYKCVECYWRYAADKEEPAQDWLITAHLGSQTILRAIPNPWGHGRRPLVALRVHPDRYGLAGDSVIDLGGDLQRFMTAIMRMGVDAMALGIHPPLMYDKAIGPDAAKELAQQRAPGGMVPVESYMLTDARFKPLLTNAYHPRDAMAMVEFLRAFDERANAISEMAMGRMSQKPATRGEVQMVLGEGDEMEAMLVAESAPAFEEIGRLLLDLCLEFGGSTEDIPALYAEANEIDPTQDVVGMMIADLSSHYDLFVSGATEAGNRAIQIQKAKEIFALVTSDPLSTPEQKYAARLGVVTAMGTPAPERFIGTREEYVNRALAMDRIQQMMQVAQQEIAVERQTAKQGGGQGGMMSQQEVGVA